MAGGGPQMTFPGHTKVEFFSAWNNKINSASFSEKGAFVCLKETTFSLTFLGHKLPLSYHLSKGGGGQSC